MRLVNDPRSLSGKLLPSGASSVQPREANVKFGEKCGAAGRSHYGRYDVIGIRALQTFDAGEELHIDYGSSFDFK